MRKLMLSIIMLFIATTIMAQGAGLNFSQTAGSYTPITGGTVLVSGTFDDTNYPVTLPAAFTFNGIAYSQVVVNTNGKIALGNTLLSNTAYAALSSTDAVPGFISAFGTDLENADSGTPEIRWEQVGNEIIFQWKDVHRYTTAINTEIFSFQVRLNTSTNAMQFVYGSFLNITTSTSSPQVGIRTSTNAFPANIYNRLVNTIAPSDNWATSVTGTANSSTCRFTSASPAASPALGQTYTWTPTDCSTITCTTNLLPANGSTISTASVNLSWNAVAGASSYKLYFGNSLPLTLQGSYSGTTATISSLVANSTYSWYVVPAEFNCAASGCESNVTTFNTTCPVTTCTSNISPANGAIISSPSVSLSWSAATGATAYKLYFGNSLPLPLQGTYTGTTATISNLLVNSTYSWYIAPATSNCEVAGCASTVTSFNTACAVTNCTSNVNPANGATINAASVNLSWSAAAGATSYKLYFGTSLPLTLQGTYTGTSATINNLLINANYSWYVRPAVSNCEVSGCESTTTTFNSGCVIVNCITNIAPVNGATVNTSVATLNWNSISGATGYDLYLGTSNPPTDLFATFTTNSAAVALSNNTYYWYVVPRAYCFSPATCSVNSTQFTIANPSPVINDICFNAYDLLSNTGIGEISFAGNFEVSASCAPNQNGKDIWYKFKAIATTASVSVSGGNPCTLDPGISAFSGSCNSLTCLGGDDAGSCSTLNSVSMSNLTPGNIYYVRISVPSTAFGGLILNGTNIGSTLSGTWSNTLTNQCINSTTYTLTTTLPAGGTFSGPGVTGSNFNASVAGVGIHTLTYTYTDGDGFIKSATNTIQVFVLPTVTWSTLLTSQCVSSTTYILTGASPAGGTFSGAGVTGTNFNASAAGAGVHTLTYTYTDGNGCVNTATNTIEVFALPTVNWTNTLVNQCVSSTTYALSGVSPSGGTYSGPGVNGTNFDASAAGAGLHILTYTYTDGNGCVNTATNTIEVFALPTVTWTNSLTNQCVSSTTYALSGAAPSGGTYSGPGVNGTNFDASAAGAGVHTLTYTYTDANGCVNNATNTIEVFALPTVTWTNALTYQCVSSTTYALSGAAPSGGTYSGPGVNGTNFDASAAGAGVHTLTYTYTDANGCVNNATNTIEVFALPAVNWSTLLTSQCVSSTAYTLTGASPAGGTFSGAGVTGTNFDASTAGAGVHTLTYTYTDDNGCVNSATNTIEVFALPAVNWSTLLTSQCVSSTAYILTGASPAGGTFSGAGVTGTNFDASAAGAGVHTLTYTYTNGNGCVNSATNTIEVFALPIVTWTGTLTNQNVGSTTYALTGGSPAGGTYSGTGVTGNNFNASIAGIGLHTLTYTYTDINGCVNSATNTIEVFALSTVTWSNTLVNQCVSSTTYTLTGGSPAGGIYSGAGVTGTNFNASAAGAGVHTLTYTFTDINGFVNSVTNTIEVFALPIVTWTNALMNQCVSSTTYALSGASPAGGTYSGPGVTGTNFDASAAGIGIHILTYTYTDGNGCVNTATNIIEVFALPTVTWTNTLTNQCINSTTYTLTGGSPSGGDYSGAGVTGTNFDASAAGAGVHTLTYTYTDGNGCVNTATNTIEVFALPTVTWTNALTNQSVSSTTYTLTGGSPAGGTYNGPGVTGTNFNASAAGIGIHTLTYTYTDGNGCVNNATNTIEVFALQTVTWTNTLTNQCVNSTTYTLTGGSPSGGTYSGAGVTGTNFNASAAGVGIHILTYSYTDANGFLSSATNTIQVFALPTVTWSTLLTSQCVSSTTYILSGASPAGGTYSGPGVTGTNFNASAAGAGVHTLTYTYTDANGCVNNASQTIEVFALPTVTWSNTLVNQCVNSTTYALTGGSPSGGTYSGPGVSGTNFNASAAGAGVHTLTYTFINSNGCSRSITNSINVNALPVVSAGTYPTQVVSGPVITLTGSPVGGAFSGPGVSGNFFNPALAGLGTHSISYNYTNPVTGCSNIAKTNITVISGSCSTTISINVSSPNNFCNSLTLTAVPALPGSYTYQWKRGAIVVGSQQVLNLSLADPDAVYTVSIISGCTANAASYTYAKQSLSQSYTIIATTDVNLQELNHVQSGSVGSTGSYGKVKIGNRSTIPSPGFAKGKILEIAATAVVPVQYQGARVVVTLPTMQYNTTTASGSDLTVSANNAVIAGNYKNVTVKKNITATFTTGTIFKKLTLEQGARATFNSSVVNFESIEMKSGNAFGCGNQTRLEFAGNTSVRVKKQVDVHSFCRINENGNKVTFYVGETYFRVRGYGTSIKANVFAPNNDISVYFDENHCGDNPYPVYMTGQFIAKNVLGYEKNTFWNAFDCTVPAGTSKSLSSDENKSIPIQVLSVEKLEVKAYPNPTANQFTLLLENGTNELIQVNVYDAVGRFIKKIERADGLTLIRFGEDLKTGIYNVEVLQGTRRSVLKLVKL